MELESINTLNGTDDVIAGVVGRFASSGSFIFWWLVKFVVKN